MDSASAHRIVDILRATYPEARTSLDHTSPFELLVATVLSAQTTDARVNTITPELFRRWPTPRALAAASTDEVEAVVRPLGFQKRRAAQAVAVAQRLLEAFDGEVPRGAAELESLPGVGRKTANVVRGNCFGEPALTVDTHVGRLSRRFGWSESENPAKVEKDVCALLPHTDWTQLSHDMIWHGRAVCTAQSPRCHECVLLELCPAVGIER